jgi:2-oxoglutarate ferredoxin oxidoreductase subunit alpha
MYIKNKLSISICGPQGTGAASAADLLANSIISAGLYCYYDREYASNIEGMHSFIKLYVSDEPYYSSIDEVHLLSTYDNESIVRHIFAKEVVPGGAILFDPSLVNTEISKINYAGQPLLEDYLIEVIKKMLSEKGLGFKVSDMLKYAELEGIILCPVPYNNFIFEMAKRENKNISEFVIMKNTISVGACLGLLELDPQFLYKQLEKVFARKGREVVQRNIDAAKTGYDYVKSNYAGKFKYKLEARI